MHVKIGLASFVAVMGVALASFNASAMPLSVSGLERAAHEGSLTYTVQLRGRGGAARVGAARVRGAPRVGARVGGARITVRPVGRYSRFVGRPIVRSPLIIRPRVLRGPGIVFGPAVGWPYYEGYPYDDSYYYEDTYPDNAIAYCMQRFKSYDPRSMTYLGYDGRRHPCP